MTGTSRRELIEEAAKAMYAPRAWTAAGEAHQSRYRSMARSALAVFEQAHTPTAPTDGERIEAIAQAIVDHDHDRLSCFDHDGYCCPCGELHDPTREEWRQHRAHAVLRAALRAGCEEGKKR